MNQTMQRTATGERETIKIRIAIKTDGTMGFFTDSGTFIEGNDAVDKLMAAMGAGGLSFDSVGQPERHRDDEEEEGVLSDAHALSHLES